ncbi:MAG TPA: DUF3570 domain-containing protein [Kofleriaceae bacterium]|nr:DUF3570 domain-containing protein [Kofleriaceae bacterium]
MVVLVVAAPAVARADGELSVRGAYYKERSTRVAQPMLDARFDVGEDGELRAHMLVDSISSASVAAGAAGTPFDEKRYEAGASYRHSLDTLRVGGGARGSSEPDYKSAFGHVRGEIDLAQRNTVLGINLAGGRDTVSNEGSQSDIVEPIEGKLWTWLGSASITQVLSPILVGQVTYDLVYLDGFQENPYRSVSAGGALEPERVPDTRLRHAALGALRLFVPASRTTLAGGYRFYIDDWGVIGHTPEARIVQEVVPDLDAHLRYRLHHQGAADFYRTTYPSADPAVEPYLTDDVKLSELTTQTFGIKLDVQARLLGVDGPLGQARAEALFEYITQSTYFGNAVAAQIALTIPFQY